MTDHDELSAELGELAPEEERPSTNHTEARVVAGFEEIVRFVQKHGRRPTLFDDADIFERLYATRLKRLRQLTEYHELLRPLDTFHLLHGEEDRFANAQIGDPVTEDDLELLSSELAELDISGEILELKHVRSAEDIRYAEEIAKREPCRDFATFKPLFDRVKDELKSGVRSTVSTSEGIGVDQGDLFIISGLIAYIAEMGEEFRPVTNKNPDARMRVIFDNGTESNLLKRSLQRSFYEGDPVRRITAPKNETNGPLFSGEFGEDDVATGHIYVLRSLSDHPTIAANRTFIHKIGVTRGDVSRRIADAVNQPTYLLAEVEEVARYTLAGINDKKFERLIHRIFEPACLDITIPDRFGKPVRPREWFNVSLDAIDEAIRRIQDGTITSVVYSVEQGRFVPA